MKINTGTFGEHVLTMNDKELEYIYRLLGNHVSGLSQEMYKSWGIIDEYVQENEDLEYMADCLELPTKDGFDVIKLDGDW